MWPWGHAVVGYLALASVTGWLRHELPRRDEVILVLVATQLPDLIDKPLAWVWGVLPSGRSLGHSLLTAVLLLALVTYVSSRYDRRALALPFGVGYLSAIVTDLPPTIWHDPSRAAFLLWPLLPSPEYETEPTVEAHLATLELSLSLVAQLTFTLALSVLIVYSLRNRLSSERP
jgi:hypothetical protein